MSAQLTFPIDITDTLIQRDGRVWDRRPHGAHLGTLHREGHWWSSTCADCGHVGDLYRTRRDAVDDLIDHWNVEAEDEAGNG